MMADSWDWTGIFPRGPTLDFIKVSWGRKSSVRYGRSGKSRFLRVGVPDVSTEASGPTCRKLVRIFCTQNAHFIMADLLQKSLFQGLIGGVGVWGTEVGLQLGLCRDLAQRLQHRRQVLDPLARGLLVL